MGRQPKLPLVKKIWRSRWFVLIYIFLVLGIFVSLSLLESSRESAAYDEVSYVPAGISYVQTHDLRINPEHPPLIKLLTGWSAEIFTNPKIDTHSTAWAQADQWEFGGQTLYHTKGNNPDRIVFWARLPIILISIFLALAIYLLAADLFGTTAGLIAITLFCLDPTMIAFSHLITFDLPMAAFITASTYCLWRALKRPSRWWFVLSGVSLGLALTTKATALAYALIIPFLILIVIPIKRPFATRLKNFCYQLALIFGSAFGIVWLVYMLSEKSAAFGSILPYGFIRTIDLSLLRYQASQSLYILGHTYASGHWWFLPLSFLLKSPLVLLLLLAYALVLLVTKKISKQALFIIVPLFFFEVIAFSSPLNSGVRYLFIAYPFIYILAAYAGASFVKSLKVIPGFGLILLGLAYFAWVLAGSYPNYLSFANHPGGSNYGYKILADSNGDWGQGLKELKKYTSEHSVNNLQIEYFGRADPVYYGFIELRPTYEEAGDNWYQTTVFKKSILEYHGQLAVSTTLADMIGLNKVGYTINGVKPYKLISGSILLYNLP